MKTELKRLPALKAVYDTVAVDAKSDPVFSVMLREAELGRDLAGTEEMRNALNMIRSFYSKVLDQKMTTVDAAKAMQEEITKSAVPPTTAPPVPAAAPAVPAVAPAVP
jgi:hypothetical protein